MKEQNILRETDLDNLEIMSIKDSVFYMVFVMMVFPAVTGFIGPIIRAGPMKYLAWE